jgi:broad specificity phosphatase PhoE
MFLQRHGESTTNLTKIFTCRKLDPCLTKEGRRQMEAVVPYYASQKIGLIITSPSKRAVESAEILGTRLGIRPEIKECLLEVDVGDLEGESERDPVLLRQFFSVVEDWLLHKKDIRFRGGESWSEVEKRFKELDSLMSSRPAIFVGHSTLFAVFLGTRGIAFRHVEELFLPRAGIAKYSPSQRNWSMHRGIYT